MNKLFTVIVCFVLFSSCQDNNMSVNEPIPNSNKLFDDFWTKMNTNYVYWDIDTTDWNKIYYDYKPLFAKLDINQTKDLTQAVEYFREITKGLIDCHYNIAFCNSLIPNYIIFPSFERKQKCSYFHQRYNYSGIDRNYLDMDYQIGTTYSSFNYPLTVLSGTIENRILFFSCTEFALYDIFHSKTTNTVQKTVQFFFDKLLNMPANIQGIIIDLRGNQGGDLGDLNFFVGHFIDSPLHFGYTQTKSGNGRLDFTPWIKAYVNPEPDGKKINLPIVILADIYSASMAEAVLMAFKAFPKCTFIGETTWGATGPLVETDVYNAGQFEIYNFFTVTTASCKFKYLDNKIYEGIGFPPDIAISYDENSIINGRDVQLEKAISIVSINHKF